MDKGQLHIEGIVDPSCAPEPKIILDILINDEDEDDDGSDEDA